MAALQEQRAAESWGGNALEERARHSAAAEFDKAVIDSAPEEPGAVLDQAMQKGAEACACLP